MSAVPVPRLSAVGWFLIGIAIHIVVPEHVLAQGRGVIPLQRMQSEIQLDGLSDEPAWEQIEPFMPTQYEPNNGAAPTEHTEFRAAYDDTYLYLSLRAYDRDPGGVRSNTLYRDRLSGDDHFEILIDTYNDNETGVLFTTTPAGIRRDAAISNDASGGGIAGGGWLNVDFNTFWDVATTVNEDGWFAEIRVPFSSLRFQQRDDGTVIFGIAMQRKVARKTERLVFPSVRPIADFAFLKPSLAQKVELRGIRPSLPLYVTPYVLMGGGEAAALNTAGSAYAYDREWKREIGGDVKYSLSNNATLDVTLNTDFAQVEADDQQINLTRFSLFFPEKRQFFQERAGIFDFRTGGLSRLFHSRRIGLTEDGRPVRLLGGARLAGRFGLWDVGLLNMQTASGRGLPSENFGVARARRQILNAYSYAGAMATSRVDNEGGYNLAYGLDTVLRLFGDDYLTLQWAHSFDHDDMDQPGYSALNGGRFTMEMERRRREAWSYHSAVAWAGADYNPGIGFSQRNDFTLLDNTVSFTWLPGPESPLIRHTLSVDAVTFLRNQDGSIESAEAGPNWEYAARNGTGLSIEAKVHFEDLRVPFSLSDDTGIPAGRYTFYRFSASFRETHTRLFQVRPTVTAGTFYDGSQVTAEVAPVWYVSPHLELAGNYQYSRIRFPDRPSNSERGAKLDAHLARLRVGTALNTRVSANIFIQYNGLLDALSANVRFRYNLREGNDLWIVYNQGVNTNPARYDPRLLLLDNQTVLLKYTHTLQF